MTKKAKRNIKLAHDKVQDLNKALDRAKALLDKLPHGKQREQVARRHAELDRKREKAEERLAVALDAAKQEQKPPTAGQVDNTLRAMEAEGLVTRFDSTGIKAKEPDVFDAAQAVVNTLSAFEPGQRQMILRWAAEVMNDNALHTRFID
jgi:chromatin segregation and condensation protein Rec8/ScpA/Scc1 (kleisin family)